MDQRLGMRINQLLLVVIIIFQILDFFEKLTPFWDYLKKIVSWALIGYLLYKMSPSSIFFGEKKEWWDTAVILAYFSMTVKNIVSFAAVARQTMLNDVLKYVTFIPQKLTAANLTVPLSPSALTTFDLLGVLPANASTYAKMGASVLTLNTQSVSYLFTAGKEHVGALLQPVGLDGMTFQLYNTLAMHAGTIERIGFIIGAIGVLILGLYASFNFTVHRHSVLKVIHEEGEVKDALHALIRIFSVLLVMSAFFVIFFNLLVEWLAIAVDAPLAMTGIIVYILVALRFHHRFHHGLDTDDLISRVGSFGMGFVKDFAKLFTEPRTVFLGISGLLVLHLLTDIGVFIIPTLTGLKDILYFGQLDAMHKPLYALLMTQWSATMGVNISLIGLYLLNAIGILFLLLLPAYIWYKAFRIATRESHIDEQTYHPQLPRIIISLGITSIFAFLIAPAFKISTLASKTLIGVDMQTQAIIFPNPLILLIALATLFILFLGLSLNEWLKKYLMVPLFISAIIFFGIYIFRFFMSSVTYYLREGLSLLLTANVGSLFIGIWLFFFLMINLLFYVFGFFSFIYELVRDEETPAPLNQLQEEPKELPEEELEKLFEI